MRRRLDSGLECIQGRAGPGQVARATEPSPATVDRLTSRARTWLPGIVGLLGLAAAAAAAHSLRINTSPSLPLGLYRVVVGSPRRLDLVVVCPPLGAARLARQRGYLAPGSCPGGVEPLGKEILGSTGDVLEVAAQGVVLNGHLVPHSTPRATDLAGRRLPRPQPGRHLLGPGEVWLFSPHPRSFDSRYFGAVPAAAVRSRIAPLWTVGEKFPADRTTSSPSRGRR